MVINMPKSKTRKKKNGADKKANLLKRLSEKTRHIVSEHLLVYIPFMEEAIQPYNKYGKEVNFVPDTVKLVENTPMRWSISCYVLCRDQNGDEYMKPFVAVSPYPCKRTQMMESMADAFMEHVKKQNQLHVLTVAWIATTIGNEPTDEMADKIFSDLDVWGEFVTDYEEERKVG